MKKLLMVAYHFPPQAGSSGLLRALKLVRYLPESGWQPVVLTAHPRAYLRKHSSQLAEVPPDIKVIRAWALDAGRHLSFHGRFFRWTAVPDRWSSWCLGAVPAGLLAIYRRKIDVIYTTYPIATAVLIGYLLHRITAKPWVVDFRDSMSEPGYPPDPTTWKAYRWLERRAIEHGSLFLFTAPSARKMYLERYPQLRAEQCRVIANGYDEEDFRGLQAPHQGVKRPIRLLHSGLIYPEERDPRPFFRALARLKREGVLPPGTLQVDLRACGAEDFYAQLISELEIGDIVRQLPALPYREALQDSLRADALLVMQAASCDHQIPAKVYEYLRARKPILALTSERGDTAALLREMGGATIVDLADEEAIGRALPEFIHALTSGTHALPDAQKAAGCSRRAQAGEVGACLSELVGCAPASASPAELTAALHGSEDR